MGFTWCLPRILKKLAYSNDKKLGAIEKEKIQRLIDIYNILGLYKNNRDLDDLIYKSSSKFSLSQEEKEFIQNKKIINICIDPSWMPLEAIDKDGQYVGLAADIIKIIKKNTEINFELVPTDDWSKSIELAKQRKCDILPMAMEVPSRKTYMDFTKSYIQLPIVIATKSSEVFVENIEAMNGKKVSLVKGYALIELLKTKYPFIEIVEVDSLAQGLGFIRQGKVHGHFEPLISLAYTLREEGITDIKIAGKFDVFWSLSIATRNDEPILKSIMQKALNSVKEEEIEEIYNKWLAVKFEEKVDYVLVYEMLALLVLLASFGVWRYQILNKANKLIEQKNQELNKAYKQYSWLAQNMDDVVWVMNIDGGFIYISPSVEKLRGFSVEEIMKQTFQELICEGSIEAVLNAMNVGIQEAKSGKVPTMQLLRVEQPCKDGSTVWTEVNSRLVVDSITGDMRFIGLTRDITKSIAYEKELQRIATIDQLTNIFNRRKIDEMLHISKDLADRYATVFGIIMIDIDYFKKINDTYGHNIGDETLQSFASIIIKHSRKSDIFGRWGGEEFIIIVPNSTQESIMKFAQNLRIEIQNYDFRVVGDVTASLGTSLYHKGEQYTQTVSRADKALYKSKENGRNCVSFFYSSDYV